MGREAWGGVGGKLPLREDDLHYLGTWKLGADDFEGGKGRGKRRTFEGGEGRGEDGQVI